VNRDQVTKKDFPEASPGYDRPSVDAHLAAVAASVAALEAQVKAVEVERDALRRNAGQAGSPGRPSVAPAPTPLRAVVDEPVAAVTPISEPEADEPDPEPVDQVVPVSGSAPDETGSAPGAVTASAAPSPDESSARLVAMKMALDGAERDEIRTKLDSDYELNDVEALLDNVFQRVG